MLDSAVLEVAIGMVFCYAAVALVASAINEMLASATKLRARTLQSGVRQLLNDDGFNALARAVYEHSLVSPRSKPAVGSGAANLPSYIRAEQFASALIDSLAPVPGELEKAIAAIADPQLRQLLQGMYNRAAGDLNHFHGQVAAWFDDGMDRVAGVYKRRAQAISFFVALVFCCVFNVDSVHLFQTLWQHPALVALASSAGEQDTATALNGLLALPIGQEYPPLGDYAAWAHNVVGLLLSASAAMFGAPFWFDLLQRLTNLRGAGPGPDKRSAQDAAAPRPAYRAPPPAVTDSVAG